MRRIALRLDRESEWVGIYDARQRRIRIKTAEAMAYGEAVRLDIELGTSGTVVVVRGLAVEEEAEEAEQDTAVAVAGLEPSTTQVVIEISPTDRDKVSHIRAFLRGALLNMRRRRRVMVRLPVLFKGIDGPVETFCRDISEDGMFIHSQSVLPERARVQMQVRFPEGDELMLEGTVAYSARPNMDPQPGMGVQFDPLMTPELKQRLTSHVQLVEQRLLSGELPDEYY